VSEVVVNLRGYGSTLTAVFCLLAMVTPGCTAEDGDDPRVDDDLGTFEFALTGVFPDVVRMKVRLYQGPVANISTGIKYELPCVAYNSSSSTGPKHIYTLDDLLLHSDYSILVELFADNECQKTRFVAYRSGIEVTQKPLTDLVKNPYYIQPYEIGAFTGLATASSKAQKMAKERVCSNDQDCKTVHSRAVCSKTKTCVIDSMFPLNGGNRRAFPNVVGLGDGRVAISGGFSVSDDKGVWSATTQEVEVFEPSLGLFGFPAQRVKNFDDKARVGLSSTVALENAAFVQVGGTSTMRLSLVGNKLTTKIEAQTCAGTGTNCPVSKAAWRVDIGNNSAFGAVLPSTFLLQPVVAHVGTASGQRILVAGGAAVPLPKSGDSRTAEAMLCEIEPGKADCISSNSFMKAKRAGAAVGCIGESDGGCKRVLIVGGRLSSNVPLAEVYHADTDTFETATVTGTAIPASLHGGTLVNADLGAFLLLGATSKPMFLDPAGTNATADVVPLRIKVETSADKTTLTFLSVELAGFAGTDGGKRSLATAVGLDDGSTMLIGGLGPNNQPLADALVIAGDGVATGRISLDIARFAAGAARISSIGPLKGCVLLAGGLTLDVGKLAALNHVEVYCPPLP